MSLPSTRHGTLTLILLDTHVLIWLDSGSGRLGPRSHALADENQRSGSLAVSAISFWEVAMLVARGRLSLTLQLATWRRDLLDKGLVEIPVDGAIGIAAAQLRSFHGDPADRLIVATAVEMDAALVTADEKILAWRSKVRRRDARK